MQFHFVPSVILSRGLELFHIVPDRLNDVNKNKRFREKYGCAPIVVSILWDEVEVVEAGADLRHLFWTLHFYNVYPLKE